MAQFGNKCDFEVVRELEKAREELNKSKLRKPTVRAWMGFFMGSGGCAEHVAFLVLWLSRHVFRFAQNVVGKHLYAMAARLARGTKVALAPAVLASLYRDLTLLKQALVTSKTSAKKVLKLYSPIYMVQIWAWERFPTLGPQPNPRIGKEQRMARWNKVTTKGSELADVRFAIESGSESFVWRPYAEVEGERCWQLGNIYPNKEKWVLVGPGMREDFKSFAKIVRVSELVGIDCIKPYFPHRVSMQFGLDQGIPGRVAGFNENSEIARTNYDRPIRDERLFIPSRSFRSGVTSQYLKWWKQLKLIKKNDVTKVKDQKRKTIMELLREIHIPTSPRTKKKKAIIEDIATGNKKLKDEKVVSNGKEAAKANKPRKRKKNCEQKLERTDRDKILDGCMLSSGAELPKETENKKQKLPRSGGNKIPDICRSSPSSELQREMRNEKKQKTKVTDGKQNFVNCGSSSGAESVSEMENKIPIMETKEVVANSRHVEARIKDPNSEEFSPLVEPKKLSSSPGVLNNDEAQSLSCMELTKVEENTVPKHDQTGYEMNYGNDVCMRSLVRPAKVCENTIKRHDEAVTEIAIEGRVGTVGLNETETNNASLNKLGMLRRTMPLEARISSLEILVARLKRERMGLKADKK